MATKKLTYKDAIRELEEIMESIQESDLDIDILSEKVKKATHLIGYCKNKLSETEDEINKILTSDNSEKNH